MNLYNYLLICVESKNRVEFQGYSTSINILKRKLFIRYDTKLWLAQTFFSEPAWYFHTILSSSSSFSSLATWSLKQKEKPYVPTSARGFFFKLYEYIWDKCAYLFYFLIILVYYIIIILIESIIIIIVFLIKFF